MLVKLIILQLPKNCLLTSNHAEQLNAWPLFVINLLEGPKVKIVNEISIRFSFN